MVNLNCKTSQERNFEIVPKRIFAVMIKAIKLTVFNLVDIKIFSLEIKFEKSYLKNYLNCFFAKIAKLSAK